MKANPKLRNAPLLVATAVALGALTVLIHPRGFGDQFVATETALAATAGEVAVTLQGQRELLDNLVSEPLPPARGSVVEVPVAPKTDVQDEREPTPREP